MKSEYFLIIFLFVYIPIFGSQDYRIISSDSRSIIIEYLPEFVQISEVEFSNELYKRIILRNGGISGNNGLGLPQIPIREMNVGVPSETGNTVQLIGTSFKIIRGKILPVPKPIGEGKFIHYEYEMSEEYNYHVENDLISFGEFSLIRDLPVQSVIIRPVQFNAQNQSIKLFERILFQINFAQAGNDLSLINERILKNAVVNFEVARNWGIKSKKIGKIFVNSVLSSGTWYRFEAPEEGIYKIDRSTIASLGITPDVVDPRTIKIYNNGGYTLPFRVTDPVADDLVENAIIVVGENDGTFNNDDYVLFYGRGTQFWEYDFNSEKVIRKKHLFSNHNYYWITSGGDPGKRMNDKISLTSQTYYSQTTTEAFEAMEEDKINLIKAGRINFGDEFNQSTRSRTYITPLPNRVNNSPLRYNFSFVNVSDEVNLPLNITENGVQIFSSIISTSGNWQYKVGSLLTSSATYNGAVADNRSMLKFIFNANSSDVKGYIDYFELEYKRELRSVSDNLIFFSKDTTSTIQYNLSNFSHSQIEVYDISDAANVKKISGANISGGQYIFQAEETRGITSKYLGVTNSAYKAPVNFESMDNSNIHGIQSGVELIIIAHRNFWEQAERLKNYRSNESPYQISTVLVDIDDIMNEFSCGSLDPTAIINFLKYAYENWQVRPLYVLLFGDGSYDYFDLEGLGKNFIPTMQTIESLDEVFGYPYDDYYGRISGNDSDIDISTGRLNIQSNEDAQIIIDKIIEYESNSERNLWRTTATLVADDGPTSIGDDGSLHTGQSEILANFYIPNYINKKKIYLATYPTVQTGLGRRKPAVNNAIVSAINNGNLIMNFTGHGNPEVWTHEVVFEKSSTIPQLKNDKYFFLTAATCDFGKFDDPAQQSATEEMLLMPEAGMIGGFTSSRPVFSNSNARLNEKFYESLFSNRDTLNLPLRMGEVHLLAKTLSLSSETNDEKFHLNGDPALRLNLPRLPIEIDSVNHQGLILTVQIKALGNVEIEGSVRNEDNSLNSNFSGEGIVTVFDSERKFKIREMNSFEITLQGGLIFRGRVSIINGKFATNFTVPKDISYENKNGKIVSYIFNESDDGIGSTDQIIVGGTDTTAVNDGNGPDIDVLFDEDNFSNSYLVNPNFTLNVKLTDETGLNTTGTGIGHKLEGILNDDEVNSIDFTNFFIGDLDAGGKSGQIRYKFTNQPLGDQKIEVKAWDIFNNFSSEENYFTVVSGNELTLRDIYNYPNPFQDKTTFTFQRNQEKPVNVKVKIYTVAGRLVKEMESFSINDKFVRIHWDGRDEDGNSLANGTYLYKINVETIDGAYKQNVLGKLAIIK